MNDLTEYRDNLPVTAEDLQTFILTEKEKLRWRIKQLKRDGVLRPTYKYIYFVQSVFGGPVKIGKAVDVKRRLASLQNGSPHELQTVKILASSSDLSSLEATLHKLFKRFRVRNEWYHPLALVLFSAMNDENGEQIFPELKE